AAEVPPAVAVSPGPRVVPGGHEVEPEKVGPFEERSELDLLVATNAGVRGPAGPMLGVEVGEDRPLELVVHVDDLEVEPCDLRDRPGVSLGLWAAAAVVDAAQMDQLQVGAQHAVA